MVGKDSSNRLAIAFLCFSIILAVLELFIGLVECVPSAEGIRFFADLILLCLSARFLLGLRGVASKNVNGTQCKDDLAHGPILTLAPEWHGAHGPKFNCECVVANSDITLYPPKNDSLPQTPLPEFPFKPTQPINNANPRPALS